MQLLTASLLIAHVGLNVQAPHPRGHYLRCCVSVGSIQTIGACLSGPDSRVLPDTCRPAGGCFAGSDLSDADRAALAAKGFIIPGDIPRCFGSWDPVPDVPEDAWCTEVGDMGADFLYSCFPRPVEGITLFDSFDYDGDGDLDLRDFAALQIDFAPGL